MRINIIYQALAHCYLGAKCSPLPVFISQVLAEHSHAHSFKYCLWLFSCYNVQVEYLCQRRNGPQRVTFLLSDPLQKVCQPLICPGDGSVSNLPYFFCNPLVLGGGRHGFWLHYGPFSHYSNILIESIKLTYFAVYLTIRD